MLAGRPTIQYGEDVKRLLQIYSTCRLGTGGMGFNWPGGSWEDTPQVMIEAFGVIDGTVADEQQKKLQEQQHAARANATHQR